MLDKPDEKRNAKALKYLVATSATLLSSEHPREPTRPEGDLSVKDFCTDQTPVADLQATLLSSELPREPTKPERDLSVKDFCTDQTLVADLQAKYDGLVVKDEDEKTEAQVAEQSPGFGLMDMTGLNSIPEQLQMVSENHFYEGDFDPQKGLASIAYDQETGIINVTWQWLEKTLIFSNEEDGVITLIDPNKISSENSPKSAYTTRFVGFLTSERNKSRAKNFCDEVLDRLERQLAALQGVFRGGLIPNLEEIAKAQFSQSFIRKIFLTDGREIELQPPGTQSMHSYTDQHGNTVTSGGGHGDLRQFLEQMFGGGGGGGDPQNPHWR